MAPSTAVPITVMLVGKTGSGKSLLANTLLDVNEGDRGFLFGVAESKNRGRLTTEPQSSTKETDGVKLRMIDTPGFFDSEESVNARWLDILKAVSLAGNSLDVILLVVSIHQIGSGADCFKIVKDHMLEYVMDRLVIIFTFAGDKDEDKQENTAEVRQKYTRQFNEEVQSGTVGATYVFSDQKVDTVSLSSSRSRVLGAIQKMHRSNPTRVEKKYFKRSTETVVRNSLEAMKKKGVITYRMYCDHMKIDEGLLHHFISKATTDNIIDEYNAEKQARILKEYNDKKRARIIREHNDREQALERQRNFESSCRIIVVIIAIFLYLFFKP